MKNAIVTTGLLAAFFSLILLVHQSVAQTEPPELIPAPDSPELPESIRSGETLEPEITIIRRAKETVTEYRINGKLQVIKVEPENAPAYYLIDTDGDGNLETRRSALDPGLLIPHWIIYSW